MTFVLRTSGLEPMLIGNLSYPVDSRYEGIYEEVLEENIPKKDRIEKLGGAGVYANGYYRSNTGDITYGKYFKKIAEPLDFNPNYKDKFEMLNDDSIKYDWNKVYEILKETDNESIYRLTIHTDYEKEGFYRLDVVRVLEENEIRVEDHPFKEFADNFRGMYEFNIHFSFSSLTLSQAVHLKTLSHRNRIRVRLSELKGIVEDFHLELYKSKEFFNYMGYFKERSSYKLGKTSKGINEYSKELDAVMTFAEATEKWGLADSTLRKLVKTNKLTENVDYRKSGKVWLITREAMEKVYGKLEEIQDVLTKKVLIHKFKVDNDFSVTLERESDENYVISTYDSQNNYIEEFSRNIVKFDKEPTLHEFKKLWFEQIQTGKF